jgi:2',5'-phosphodiesterase
MSKDKISPPIEMRVFTFNILSSSYSKSETYPTLNPEVLKNEVRWPMIEKIISGEMYKGSIIHLQEVTEFHRGFIETMAGKHNYRCIAANYDHVWSGFMGIVTLIPHAIMVDHVKFFRPSSLVKKFLPATIQPESDWSFTSLFQSMGVYKVERVKSYTEILSKRNNVMIMITIQMGGKQVCLINYHMPCVYWVEGMLFATCALALHVVNEYAKERPVIFAGDFNVTPNSDGYNLITGSRVENTTLNTCIAGPPKLNLTPLYSASAAIRGEEPLFTYNSVTKSQKMNGLNIFTETLDYIFFRNVNIISMEVYPDLKEYVPSMEHPSDHLCLVSVITIY